MDNGNCTYSFLFYLPDFCNGEHPKAPKLALHLTGATLEEHIANLPKSFPLLGGWAKLLEKSSNNAWKAKDNAKFKKTLNRIYEGMEGDDEMDEEDGCKLFAIERVPRLGL
ncbi:hypothetical protein RHMOL_Rhmol09G0072700 [Rhododendron molle]|uniref:Uncharacterized protein n=1 Tax=Rhododendron molle TaxID=49168 RepID=A0ACC0MBE7_RHOML|nr:hypothetical protein RHMOL_Rhmol09G0072700 [Rhododendron molle]